MHVQKTLFFCNFCFKEGVADIQKANLASQALSASIYTTAITLTSDISTPHGYCKDEIKDLLHRAFPTYEILYKKLTFCIKTQCIDEASVTIKLLQKLTMNFLHFCIPYSKYRVVAPCHYNILSYWVVLRSVDKRRMRENFHGRCSLGFNFPYSGKKQNKGNSYVLVISSKKWYKLSLYSQLLNVYKFCSTKDCCHTSGFAQNGHHSFSKIFLQTQTPALPRLHASVWSTILPSLKVHLQWLNYTTSSVAWQSIIETAGVWFNFFSSSYRGNSCRGQRKAFEPLIKFSSGGSLGCTMYLIAYYYIHRSTMYSSDNVYSYKSAEIK